MVCSAEKRQVALVNEYDGKYDKLLERKYFEMFLDFVGISEEEFHGIAEGFINKDIWGKDEHRWAKRYELV